MWVENTRVNFFNFGWVDFRENRGKKREWKIGEKIGGNGVWLGGGWGEKSSEAQLFFLLTHQNSIFTKWGENGREKGEDVC